PHRAHPDEIRPLQDRRGAAGRARSAGSAWAGDPGTAQPAVSGGHRSRHRPSRSQTRSTSLRGTGSLSRLVEVSRRVVAPHGWAKSPGSLPPSYESTGSSGVARGLLWARRGSRLCSTGLASKRLVLNVWIKERHVYALGRRSEKRGRYDEVDLDGRHVDVLD